MQSSLMQLIMDQIEELIVTIIEEVRERPSVAAAIVAALVGAWIGSALAGGGRRRQPPAPVRATQRRMSGLGDAAQLAGLGMRLLQNPIVRSYLRAALTAQLRRRFSR